MTLDHPKVIAALEWEVARASELGGYDAAEGFRKQQPKNGLMDMLLAGTLTATINSTSQLVTVNAAPDLDWIPWAPPPGPGVSQTHTWSGGYANVVPAGVKDAGASFALARFLSDEAFQRIQNASGRLPTLKAVAKDPYWNSVDPRIKQFVELLPYSHARPATAQTEILDRELDGAETAALQGTRPAREALTEANQHVNDAIKEGRAS
jgi:multiple sugar transport system substrate-binding protein